MNPYKHNYDLLEALLQGREWMTIKTDTEMYLEVGHLDGTPLIELAIKNARLPDWKSYPGVRFAATCWPVREGEFSHWEGEAYPFWYWDDVTGYESRAPTKAYGWHHRPDNSWEQRVVDTLCERLWQRIIDQGYFERAKKLGAEYAHRPEGDPGLVGPIMDMDPEIGP